MAWNSVNIGVASVLASWPVVIVVVSSSLAWATWLSFWKKLEIGGSGGDPAVRSVIWVVVTGAGLIWPPANRDLASYWGVRLPAAVENWLWIDCIMLVASPLASASAIAWRTAVAEPAMLVSA